MQRSLLRFLVGQALAVFLAAQGNPGVDAAKVRGDAQIAPASGRGTNPETTVPQRQEPPPTDTGPPAALSRKQKKELLKSNAEKMKQDADQLVALAESLKKDVNTSSSENVLSLKIVDQAEKIEKLARRIKNRARGN